MPKTSTPVRVEDTDVVNLESVVSRVRDIIADAETLRPMLAKLERETYDDHRTHMGVTRITAIIEDALVQFAHVLDGDPELSGSTLGKKRVP